MPIKSRSDALVHCDGVLFVERMSELAVCGKDKSVIDEFVAKASLNRAMKSHALDPKLGELSMVRLKRW